MQTTINDVAELAGVSIATVSRVLHNIGYISRETKEKVDKAVNELGYVPNSIARSLKESSSFTVGITAYDLSVSFYPEVIKRIEEQLLPLGYATLVSSTFDQPQTEEIVLKQMLARRVDVLLVNSTGVNEALLNTKDIPVAFYDRRPINCRVPAVYMDKARSMYIALESLVKAGHAKIMLVTGSRDLNSNLDRYLGFQRFINETETCINNYQYRFGKFTYEYGVNAIEEILKMPRNIRPTAIITGGIAITAGIIDACQKYGMSIPGDIALISTGNFPYANIMKYKLTYLDDRSDVLSDELVKLVKRKIARKKVPDDYEVAIEPLLIQGETT